MIYLIFILIGAIIGLFPSSYFTNRFFQEKKVNNKIIQMFSSIFIDLLKGALIVYIIKFLMDSTFIEIQLSLISGVISHCFFQGFKFQTIDGNIFALGGLLMFIPTISIIWIIIWTISFIYKRNINFSIISSAFLTGLLSITSSYILNNDYWFTHPTADSDIVFKITIGILFVIIIVSELSNIKAYFGKEKLKDS
ncbi:MAG: glycerol-3-phosphate acyltransferase [Bacteroidota bacterium]